MPNLLKNAGFEDQLTGTFSSWKGWYLDPSEGAVCVYQKKTPNAKTGFYQDIPASRFESDGKYQFQMKLLSPTANATASPTVWVFKESQDPKPTQMVFSLKAGQWQIVQVDVNITRNKLKKVRAELYFGPDDCEMIIQRAYFGK